MTAIPTDRPLVIGIVGGSGSGKTTFLRKLTAPFKEQITVLSMDDYYRPREEQPVDAEGIRNFDLPESFDMDAFTRDIHRLLSGETVTRLEYTFNNALATPRTLTFRPAPVLIVEGIFAFYVEAVRRLMDVKLFIRAHETLKVIRRIRRDRIERNYPLDDVIYRYEHHVLPTYHKYIEPYMTEADLVINNNTSGFDSGLAVVQGYLHYRLETTDFSG